MATKSAIKNPVKNVTDADLIKKASSVKTLIAFTNKATGKCNELKKNLIESLADGMISALIEENDVQGTFQILLESKDSNFIEVPMSIATDPLSPDELMELAELTPIVFDQLFEEKDVFESITDYDALLTHLGTLDDKKKGKAFKVKPGKITIEIEDTDVEGVNTKTAVVPMTSFFGRAEAALKDSDGVDRDCKLLASFIEERVKGAVKVGTKVREETK